MVSGWSTCAAVRALLCVAMLACGLAASAGELKTRQERSEKQDNSVHNVSRATSEIVVDGVLEEKAWDKALTLELQYEVEPGENISPPVRTVCKVTYDERNVYFAFKAYDREPDRILARYTDRDKAWDDDIVGIVLDTFNDQRRAYELFSNPLGVQNDAINNEVGSNWDDSWNAIWKSAGRITSEGYEVEMAVPFNQIRFQEIDGVQTWGFDAMRCYPRTHRHKIGLFPRQRGINSYLSQTIKLTGISGASPGKNLELIPTLTSARRDSRDSMPDGEMHSGSQESDLGLSVRWGITPNVSLNGALNPDFSQVEADAVQLDVNEQFSLFFPETRPFFMEGADYFNTRLISLVHTRFIAEPSAAVKLTGKQGRHTYGLFTARDRVTNIVFPGPEGSSSARYDLDSSDTVGRYRFDMGETSVIGATVTERSGSGYSNRVLSADLLYKPTDADQLTVEFASSRTRYAQEMIEDAGVRSDTFSDSALGIEYNHSVRGWWVNYLYSDVGGDFRADLGWRPQVGYKRHWVSGAKVWWGDGDSLFNRLALGLGAYNSDRVSGDLLERNVESWVNYNGPKQSFFHICRKFRTRNYDGRDYDLEFGCFDFNFWPTGKMRVGLHGFFGDWIDYVNSDPADINRMESFIYYNFGRHLSLELRHTRSYLNVAGGRLFLAQAPELRVIHQFNNRAYLRAILQYVSVERHLELYDEEIRDDLEPETRELFTQLLFSYKINPQTAFYLGYSDNHLGTEDYSLTRAYRTFFMKLGYAWVR